jgi:hypothetical protein
MDLANKILTVFLITSITLLIGCNDNGMFWKKKKKVNPLETRWVFKNELNNNEKEIYNQVSGLIDSWWKAFEQNQRKIDENFTKGIKFEIVKFMNNNLNVIHDKISWEFGPAIMGNGHRLIITPESNKKLRPLVKESIKRAPKIDGWEFYAYRLPESYEIACETVKARTGGEISDLKIQASINEFNLVDIYFTRETCQTKQDFDQAFNDAFVAIETLLGEENLDIWVGAIEVDSKTKDSLDVLPINELNLVFTNKLNEIKNNIFQQQHFRISQTASWTMMELKPQKETDYAKQTDLFVAKSMNVPMWNTAHSGHLFYSERFSKFGETFCYVKLDGTQGLDEEKFEDKGAIEDALDSVLIKEQVGCCIGGGTGLKYSYIDLALVDLEKGIKIIKEVLRKGNITKNSWILFFDSELENEWIGIWDDSPKPMLAN